jgi:hypothetical protein
LLFAFVWWVERPLRQAAQTPPDRRVLPNLNPSRVTAVEVQPVRRGAIRAVQTNLSWELTKPISYPAAAAEVRQLLDKLAHWEWRTSIASDELTNHPDAEEEFGFVPPQFTIALEDGGGQRTLEVGSNSAIGDEVYLKMKGGYRIYIADAEPLKWLPTEPDQWRDRSVMDLAPTAFQRIEVRSTNSSFDGAMALELDTNTHLWAMSSPVQARADSRKIAGLLAQLQSLQALAFVSEDGSGLDSTGLPGPGQTPPLRLTLLRDATNKVFELEMGGSPTNQTNLVFARRQRPANVIEISKGPLLPWEESYTNFLDAHLTSLSAELITSIHVIGGNEFSVEKRTNGSWLVRERDEIFPADKELMDFWFESLTNMPVAVEQMTVANVAMYGLDVPLLRYEIHYTAAQDHERSWTNELRFGAGTNEGGKIFERFEGYKSVNALTLEQYIPLPKFGWQMRERRVFHFETNEVTGIAVHQGGADRRFIRDAQNHWTLAPTSSGSVTPETPYAIEETVYRMGQLKAVYWDGVGEDPSDPYGFGETDHRLDFEINRGSVLETNSIHFGRTSQFLNPYAYVTRDGRRLVFEFPVNLYQNWLAKYLGIPSIYRPARL